MTLTPEEKSGVETEVAIFNGVARSVADQIVRAEDRLYSENQRARALTSEIHETRRVEDKALLASDEAVSHGLKDSKRNELDILRKQLTSPYFARIEVEEEDAGKTRTIEYKLGFSANPELRIIDWRRAPVSKLYYEYKEGDEYLEEILGRERAGRVLLRNRIEVEKGSLKAIQTRNGTFTWNAKSGEWESNSGSRARRKSSDGHLPEILSLITPEQFRSITVDANSAILLQGVAGSGKTTVALHRLAWLLHSDNSPLQGDQCVFLMLSPALRRYVESSLPSVGIEGIKVRTYHEWTARTLQKLGSGIELHRPSQPAPATVNRLKRSMALLKTLEKTARTTAATGPVGMKTLQDDLIAALDRTEELLSHDETKLLTRDAIREARVHTAANFEAGTFDWADDALLVRAYQVRCGGVVTERGDVGTYGHIIADEVQDFSPVELATIIGAVKEPKDLTLVGDTSQNLDEHGSFPGWERLQKHWNFSGEISTYVSLEISHRSTLPIMRLADYIQQRSVVKTGRTGRTPIWFKCLGEQHGLEYVLKWLSRAIELYPTTVTAVICASPEEAKFTFKLLQPTFGQAVRLGDSYSFSFEEGILVTDVRQVKGLEFFSVLLWNPTPHGYPTNDLGRNLLYVAATRAEENLCVVSWGRPAAMLPPFGRSPLVRSMDMTIVEEDTEE